jgi:hypothetical protein
MKGYPQILPGFLSEIHRKSGAKTEPPQKFQKAFLLAIPGGGASRGYTKAGKVKG